jgi:hypothetical protein
MRNDKTMRRLPLLIAFLYLLLAAAPLAACEFTYAISGPGLSAARVIPGVPLALQRGAEYTLSVSYQEDHRNCLVPPEDTLFLVEEERWKAGKDYLPLQLLQAGPWTDAGRSHTTELTFRAGVAGTWALQVLRECTRGGYDQSLLFTVK